MSTCGRADTRELILDLGRAVTGLTLDPDESWSGMQRTQLALPAGVAAQLALLLAAG